MKQKVLSIYISPMAVKLPIEVESVRAISNIGLEGDRYAKGVGSFTHWPGNGRNVTLIESEVLNEINHELQLSAAESRRNIISQGIKLNDLVGLKFKVGDVLMYGARLCDPCKELEDRTRKGVLKALVGKGGLRADILSDGIISQNDPISIIYN